MSQFARQLTNLEKLGGRAADSLPLWWKDLLSLWTPSGVDSGSDGLRLAIRDGYLNFYRLGQSIARVEIDGQGMPTATTHFKYVGGTGEGRPDREYVALRDDWLVWQRGGREERRAYKSGDLKSWIAVVNHEPRSGGKSGFAGDEKKFVDRLVTANPNVIDLEMGLPAWGERRTAPRMDLVAIEEGRRVVFWEAKLVEDSRLRCRAPIERNSKREDLKPEVLKQLYDYREFLANPEHVRLVETAYRQAAREMQILWGLTGRGEEMRLGDDLLAAARLSELDVDQEPRLVVFNKPVSKSWSVHEAKLRNVPDEPHARMIVLQDCAPLVLRYPI